MSGKYLHKYFDLVTSTLGAILLQPDVRATKIEQQNEQTENQINQLKWSIDFFCKEKDFFITGPIFLIKNA